MSSTQRPSPAELAAGPWRKSSHSGANNACVEIAPRGLFVGVRDSKDPNGPVLCFEADVFTEFLDAVNNGHFSG